MYVERANTMKAIEQNHCRWQFPSICQDGKEHTQVWVWKWAGTDKDRGSRLVLVLQQAADNKWQRCQLRSTYHLPPRHDHLCHQDTRPHPGRSRSPSTSQAPRAPLASGIQRICVQCEMRSRGWWTCPFPTLAVQPQHQKRHLWHSLAVSCRSSTSLVLVSSNKITRGNSNKCASKSVFKSQAPRKQASFKNMWKLQRFKGVSLKAKFNFKWYLIFILYFNRFTYKAYFKFK